MFVKIKEYVQKVFTFLDRPIPLIIFAVLCLWRVSVLEIPDYDKGVISGWIFASLFYKFVYEPRKDKQKSELKN